MPDDRISSSFRSAPVFADWPAALLSKLSGSCWIRMLKAGQSVRLAERQRGPAAIVLEGGIRLVRRGEGVRGSPREVTVESFVTHDVVVDPLFDQGNAATDEWIATGQTALLFIARQALLDGLGAVPSASLSIARELERRLRRSKATVAAIALERVEFRLVAAIEKLAEKGEKSPGGVVVRNCPTEREIGNTIGARRETVSRILKRWAQRGLMTGWRRRVTLTPKFFVLTAGGHHTPIG